MKKLKIFNSLTLFAMVLILILPAYNTVSATTSWNMNQGTLSTGRIRPASVVANGKIYAIGGDINGYQENYTIEEYDPLSDSWTVKAVSHLPRIRFGAAVVNNKIYIIGGSHQGVPYQYDNAVEEYDPLTNQITVKASMPTAREFLGVVAVNNKIYAIGGSNSSGVKNVVEEYDPSNTTMGTWTTKASMPTARFLFSAAEANGKIYAIAGNANNEIQDKVEEYDPQLNTWTTKADLSISWDTNAATSFNGKIYMAGGGISGVYCQKVFKEYNPTADTWTDLPDMLKCRSFGALACVNGMIHAFGGDTDAPVGQTELYGINNCCAEWSLDGNAADSSGNGNNGTLVGSPTTVSGVSDQALSFSGSNYVTIPDSSTVDFGTGDFSIAFWIKSSSTKTGNTILEKRSAGTYVGYDVTMYNGRLLFQMADSSGYTTFLNTSTPQINNGVWHSAVITVDRDNTSGLKFYIDGAFICSFDPTGKQGDISNSESLYIGKHRDWSSWNLVGAVDEIKMYKQVLSASEILQQYTP